jgi:adenylate cyclase
VKWRILHRSRLSSWQTRLAISAGVAVFNLVGIAIVSLLAAYVVPLPQVPNADELRLANLIAGAIVGIAGVLAGIIGLNFRLDPMVQWIRRGAPPEDEARISVLRAPAQLSMSQAVVWTAAAVGFGVFNARYDMRIAVAVTLIIALSGLSTSAFTYLAAERAMRGFARKALEGGAELPPHRSVVRRQMVNWVWGTGVALLGIILVGIAVFIDQENTTRIQLAVTMVVVGGLGLTIGGTASYWAAKATADPIRGLRSAMGRVERGDYDVSIPIYDATEIGHLQAGFNRMAQGLQERELIRDLFGRHVGEDVARHALDGGVKLGGEAREVAVLFVDVVGSTSIAEDKTPEQVVDLLNRFFTVVIDVVDRNGGWVNKFEGDAALAIWGGPLAVDDRATASLAAARELGRRLRQEIPELRAGIGVSAGRAVAGNVGAFHRYEYTVIGDPVNEAARLTDVAKGLPGLVVANASLLDAATDGEAAHWTRLAPVVVRGRSQPTQIATPV